MVAGSAITLSLTHHWLNFWGLPWQKQILILLVVMPVIIWLLSRLVDRTWILCTTIKRGRWLLFLYPGILVSLVLARSSYASPVIWHLLEVIPAATSSSTEIKLLEIKISPGKVANFGMLEDLDGWVVQDGVLQTSTGKAGNIKYAFLAPIGEMTSLIFFKSPYNRDVSVILDGKRVEVDLDGRAGALKLVTLTTLYKQGIPSEIILVLVALCDFLAFFFFILLVWLMQELSQNASSMELPDRRGSFLPHAAGIAILLSLSLLLHSLNFFAVPLILASDSSSYLNGAIHWVQSHNFEGVPSYRGPGTTFLFIPALVLFGKNPWGVKMVLHLLAIASVPVLYRLGWQLFKQRSFAFFSGSIAILMPEMYLYSNIVMSDVPNIFFVLACCTLLISALEIFSWENLIAFMLVGSFAALLRPENVTLLIIGAGFLLIKIIWEKKDPFKRLQMFGATIVLALLPLIYWSAHNHRVHGFFGLSNYVDEVLYDGWVYFGEASGFHITDSDSPAVQAIAESFNAYDRPIGYTLVPTGWELYPTLLEFGYTEREAIKLLGDAAKDSIRKNPNLSMELYLLKLKKSFVPPHSAVLETTFDLIEENGEIVGAAPQKASGYFESEKNIFPALIPWQRKVYDWLPVFDRYVYRPLVFFCLGVALLAVYQKQFFTWMPVIAIAFSRMFIPITIGIAHWHYMLAGIAVLLLFVFLALQTLQGFLSLIFSNPKTG